MVNVKCLYQNTNSAERTIRSVLVLAVLMVLMVVFLFGGKVAAQENYATWAYTASCTLNTSDGAANVAGTVTDFPVLIRLNAGNFDFSQAQAAGSDIRFARSDDTHLNYQIERFDGGTPDSAEIWVRLDTVWGYNPSQAIKMYWGNAAAADSSRGATVFDTANGFAGVWHLNEEQAGKSGAIIYADGTINGNTGLDSLASTLQDAFINKSHDFNTNDFVEIPNTQSLENVQENSYTISAWYNPYSIPTYAANLNTNDIAQGIVIKSGYHTGPNYDFNQKYSFSHWIAAGPTQVNVMSNTLYFPGTYSYVTGTVDRAAGSLKLYVNGNLENSTTFDENAAAFEYGTMPFRIGIASPSVDNNYRMAADGKIDEVRIEKVVRSPDWVKLSYENQKPAQSLVRIGATTVLLRPTIDYSPTIIIDTQNVLAVVLRPTLGGGAATSITISPGLPADLTIDSTTGIISGTPKNVQGAIPYTITATNATGSGTATITLSVLIKRPVIAYARTAVIDTQNVLTTTIVPVLTGGAASRITITPVLPAGIIIDSTTGIISGTPTALKSATQYIIKAVNASDSAKDTITISVVPAIVIPKITYLVQSATYTINATITPNIPTNTGTAAIYKVSSALPAGLLIDSTNGTISGKPTVLVSALACIVTAVNSKGSALDTITITVVPAVDTTAPVNSAILTLNALSTSQISVMWNTPESQSADADSVLVLYSSVRIPVTPFDTILGICKIMGTYPVGTTAGTANHTLSGLTERTVYYVALFVRDAARNYSRGVANTVTTRGTNDVFNPLVVHGRYADSNHIAITISNFSTLDTTAFPPPYVDSIGVWYNAGSFLAAPVRGSAALVKYSIRAMIANNTGGVFSALLPVPVLTSDTVYYISAAPFWRQPDSLPLFVAGNGDRVLMRDTIRPVNSLTVAGQYLGGDSVMLTIGNLASLDTLTTDSVIIWHGTSDTAVFTDAQFTLHLSARTIRRAQTATYTTTIKDLRFKGLLDTIYAVWLQVGKNSLRSAANDTFFTVGTLRPQNPLVLTAEAISPTRVELSWSAPAAATDSVRVWYGTAGIPKSGDIPAATFRYVNQPLAARIDTIDGLQSNTIYYFAMQVYHSGLWSLVTAASSDTVFTPPSTDTNRIVNTVDITELVFDTTTNEIRVRWQVDTTLGEQYVGIQYGIGSYSLSLPTAGLTVRTSAQGEMVIALREPLRFDTTYYVSLWAQKVDGQWSNPTPLSKDTVRIAAFKWQAISYFNRRVSPDTVRAYNGRIVLFNDPAYDLEVLNDVLDRVPLNSTVTGFIPVSTGFKFRNGYESLPFNVGFAYDTALARVYGTKSIRMYRMVLDSLMVEDNTVIDSVAGIVYVRTDKLVDPFIAAIDTVVPTITILSNDTTIYILGKSVQDTIRVSDNIGNVKWRLEVGKGGDALRSVPPPLSGNTVSGNNGIINTSVGTGYIDDDNGVRILLITSDGVHTDTINLSRQVVRPIAETFTIPSLKWRPLYTAAMIENPTSDSCLWGLQATGETVWKFDIKRYRVFRWYETAANKPLPEKWVELADSNKQHFSFVPGRLMWVKTAAEQSVVMGRGVTMSLRKNYTGIKLPPHSWTDFGLPFRFGIALSDILAATGSTSDSLEWYGWQLGADSMYAANPLYVPGHALPALRSVSGVTLGFSGYTVYNRRSDTVTLKVPPIPKVMSRGNGAIAKVKNTPAWCLSVITCNAARQPIGRVECGYLMEKGSSATVFMVPPSFASVTTAITDDARTGRYGHKIYHQPQDGGYFFDVVFSNKSAIPQTIRYTIAGLSQLPQELRATIIRTNASIDPSDTITVTIAANAELHELLAVGDAGYLAKVNNRIMGFDLVLGSIFPNPVGRMLTIRYTLPFGGVSAVQFEVYDVAGRMVWSKLIKNGLRAGANTFAWDTKQTTLLSRRLYILRMKTIDEKGNTNKVMVHTFTYWGR